MSIPSDIGASPASSDSPPPPPPSPVAASPASSATSPASSASSASPPASSASPSPPPASPPLASPPPASASEAKAAKSDPAPFVTSPHTDLPEKLTCIPFQKTPWAFYRCLMRGYILTGLLDLVHQDDETEKQKALVQIGRVLNGGIKYDVLHSSNVFVFDNVEITECDMIFGMLKRISNWAEYKCSIDAPTRNSVSGKEDVFSGGDYFIEQLKDFFSEVKKIKSDDPAATDPKEFIRKITQRMHLPGDDVVPGEKKSIMTKVTSAFTNVGQLFNPIYGGSARFTRRRKGGGKERQKVLTNIGADIKKNMAEIKTSVKNKVDVLKTKAREKKEIFDAKVGLATGTQLRHLYYKSLNIADKDPSLDSAFNRIKLINNVEKKKDKLENDENDPNGRTAIVNDDGSASTVVTSEPEAHAEAEISPMTEEPQKKQTSKPKDPLIHEKIIPTPMRYMTVDQYFEKLSSPIQIHVKNETGVKNNTHIELVPEVWGHPLVLLIPFARAMLCDIELYELHDGSESESKSAESDSEPGSGSDPIHTAKANLTLVYYVRCDKETRPVIRMLIPAKTFNPTFLTHYTTYMAEFQLLVDHENYTQGKDALNAKLEKMNAENELNRQISLLPHFKNMLYREKLACKEVDKKIDKVFDEIHDLMQDPKYPEIPIQSFKNEVDALSKNYQEKQNELNGDNPSASTSASTSANAGQVVDMTPDTGKEVVSKFSETAAQVKKQLKKYATDIKNKIRIPYTTPEKLEARLTNVIRGLQDLQTKKKSHTKKIDEYRKKIIEIETLEHKFKNNPDANPVDIIQQLHQSQKVDQQLPSSPKALSPKLPPESLASSSSSSSELGSNDLFDSGQLTRTRSNGSNSRLPPYVPPKETQNQNFTSLITANIQPSQAPKDKPIPILPQPAPPEKRRLEKENLELKQRILAQQKLLRAQNETRKANNSFNRFNSTERRLVSKYRFKK